MRAITKECALSVVARACELQAFALRQDTVERVGVPRQERTRLEPIPRMCPNECFHRRSPVADEHGKVFVRDREDLATRFSRESVVEDACLKRARVIRLHEN